MVTPSIVCLLDIGDFPQHSKIEIKNSEILGILSQQ